MKKYIQIILSVLIILTTISCGGAKKVKREEAKRKRTIEKMEKLESDKKQFEQKNKTELGK